MRLVLTVFFTGVLLAVPAVVLAGTVLDRESQSETATRRLGVQFLWPSDAAVADPEFALRTLAEAAAATRSNVLRSTVSTAPAAPKRITHYLLMGGERTALFQEFTLRHGRWLSPSETREGGVSVSSVSSATTVGVPAVFAERYELTFAPLRQAFDSLPAQGLYHVEGPGVAAETGRFLALLHQRLQAAGATTLTLAQLTPPLRSSHVAADGSLDVLAYLLIGVAALVAAFLFLREGKRIGVLRLLGYSSPRIWYTIAGRIQALALLAGVSACAVLTLAVPGVDGMLLRSLARTLASVTAVGGVSTLAVGLVIIHRVKVSDLIKGTLQ